MPTLPEEFQMPEPGKYAFPLTVSAVVDAYSNTEVEEAERAMGEPLNHICVVVEFASCPKLVVGVQAKELPAPVSSVPQTKFPAESVSMVLHEVSTLSFNPPPVRMRPLAKVEEAVVLRILRRLAESHCKVEEAVVEVAFNHPKVGVVEAE